MSWINKIHFILLNNFFIYLSNNQYKPISYFTWLKYKVFGYNLPNVVTFPAKFLEVAVHTDRGIAISQIHLLKMKIS